MKVYLWHIDSHELAATVDDVPVYRATHVPLDSGCQVIDHPFRRYSFNIWVDMPVPQFSEEFFTKLWAAVGTADPYRIGVPLCCKRPDFWHATVDEHGDEELTPVGVSSEGAAWAAEVCPKCGAESKRIVSPIHSSTARACTKCGHVWTEEAAGR